MLANQSMKDGEWISTVIDDRLCLRFYEDQRHCLLSWNPDDTELRSSLPEDFTKNLYKGKDALYFASCKGDNDETWLPLLEKAYAKAHLSYQSIEGGFAGEGVVSVKRGEIVKLLCSLYLPGGPHWRRQHKHSRRGHLGQGECSFLATYGLTCYTRWHR